MFNPKTDETETAREPKTFRVCLFGNAAMGHVHPQDEHAPPQNRHVESPERVLLALEDLHRHFPDHFPRVPIIDPEDKWAWFEEAHGLAADQDADATNTNKYHLLTHLQKPLPNQEAACTQCRALFRTRACPRCGSARRLAWMLDRGGDTYATSATWTHVQENMDILATALRRLRERTDGNRYAYLLLRPPGHHCWNRGSGFCPANNAAMAAVHAARIGFRHVVVLDWDYHDADGTTKLLREREDVLLISIHAFGPEIYPGTGDADENAHNVMKHPCLIENERDRYRYDDQYFLRWMQSRCVPAIQAWRADLVIVCNGLDAHRDDPLAGLNLTNLFYREATRMLQELEVPLLFVLEGGYSPQVVQSVSHDMVSLLASEET